MNAADLTAGDRVRAFHPRRFGVVDYGTVISVGRKYARVDFGELLGGICRVPLDHVLETVNS